MVDEISDLDLICRLLSVQAAQQWQFAQRHGIPLSKPVALESRLLETNKGFSQLRELIQRVQNHDLAIRFTGDDFDIVNPQAGDETLGFWPLVAIAAVVIAAGALAGLAYYRREYKDIESKYNPVIRATKRQFCENSSPEVCNEWNRFLVEEGYGEREDLIDEIGRNVGKSASSGAKWGLTIGIPLLALYVIWSLQKKR